MLLHRVEIDLASPVTLADLREFVRVAEESGVAASEQVNVERDQHDEVTGFSLYLGGGAKVDGE